MTIDLNSVTWANNTVGNSLSVNQAITIAAGESIVIATTGDHRNTGNTISCPGQTVVTADISVDTTANQDNQLHYILNPGAGTYTVTHSASAGGGSAGNAYLDIGVGKLQGAALTGLLVANSNNTQGAPGTGTDAINTGTAQTPTGYPCLVVALVMDNYNAGTPSAGTGFTSVGTGFGFGGPAGARLEIKRITSGTAQGLFTDAGGASRYGSVMAVFLEAGGGSPSNDNFGAQSGTPDPVTRKPASRLYEAVAPVGALLAAAGLSSVGWGPSTPVPPRAQSVNAPVVQPVQPIGTGTFALAKFPHISVQTASGASTNRPTLQASQPTGPLKPFVSASIGWLATDLPLDTPLVAKRVSEISPTGTLIAASSLSAFTWHYVQLAPPRAPSPPMLVVIPSGDSTLQLPSIGWLSCDAPPKSSLVAPRAQQPVGAESSLNAFVSASTGWFPADCRTPPLSSRRVEPSAPTGPLSPFVSASIGWQSFPQALLPKQASVSARPEPSAPVGTALTTALTSLGWMGVDSRAPVLAAPRTQETQAPSGPLVPFVSPSFGWQDAGAPARAAAALASRVETVSPVGNLLAPALTSLGWLGADFARPQSVTPRPQDGAQPPGPLTPFVSLSSGWQTTDTKAPVVPAPRAQDAQQPVNALRPFVSTTLGWLTTEAVRAPVPAPKAQESAAPTGPLTPFISASTGWLTVDLPLDLPLISKRVGEISPTGTLLTPQQFGWNTTPQERPAPVVPRKLEASAPVGTAFAIALPSNGWLATDNPRTPLALGKSTPTDPVGNLLVLPPLPNLTWLATENPRTPLAIQRSVIVDPVGSKLPLPGALGPYWHVDLPPRAQAPSARVTPTDPIGSFAATLTSIGWLSPFEAPRSPLVTASRPQPSDPLKALQFGGTPWASVELQAGRAAAVHLPESTAPVGTLIAPSLTTIGWVQVELPARQSLVARKVDSSAPVGTLLTPATLSSLGWDVPTATKRPTGASPAQEASAPVSPLQPFVSVSSGWQVVDLPKVAPPRAARPEPTGQHHTALAFGGTPWAGVEQLRSAFAPLRSQEASAPVGQSLGQLTSLAWQHVDGTPPNRLVFPRPQPSSPVGLLIPPPVLPSMGWQSAVDLPPRWSCVCRVAPSEPVGSSFALAFNVAPARRCSPVFETASDARLSPIFDESR